MSNVNYAILIYKITKNKNYIDLELVIQNLIKQGGKL